ncbi:MAG: hypothetical protein D3910_14715, partial [Candidatus Electrothrix sp. ATG2]|nr:hypothetical protein [Candidatus Electrothrix sp. ATG2]
MNQQANNKQRFIWILLLLLSTAGLVVSLYSAHSHYKNYTDPLYSSFCAISKAINCDTVSQSPWSIFLNIPVGWWGVLFYLFFFVLLVTEKYQAVRAWQGFFFISLFASIITLGLAGIAAWKIKSLCLVCLIIYTITFALTYTCWIGKRRCKEAAQADEHTTCTSLSAKNRMLRHYGIAASVFITGILLLHFFLPRYWEVSSVATEIDNQP